VLFKHFDITAAAVSAAVVVVVSLKSILELTWNTRNQVFWKMKTVCNKYARAPINAKTIDRWINFKDKNI
jgi:hypothetical protein